VSIALVGVLIAGQYTHTLDRRLAGHQLSTQASAAVTAAKKSPLAPVSLDGVPPEERATVANAVTDASTSSFHLGIGVGGALVACGGILGGLAIRNPERVVSAQKCAGGQLVSAPEEALTAAVASDAQAATPG
jgi:hypothetical protein